jgi:hypothetical protein
MKKKQYVFLGSAVVTVFVLVMAMTACGSAPAGTGPGSGAPPPAQSKQIERITLDYQGAAIGSDIPTWVEAAVNSDLATIQKMPRFSGKEPVVDWGTGQNLDLVRSFVNNFNVSAGISRRITTYVEAEFGGAQLGSKDSPDNRNFVKEIVASFSQTEFSGLAREMDYWIKLRIIDHGNGTQTEEYRYYVVYSIPEDVLQYQIDAAMGKISAKTKEQEEIKADVETAMKQARFNKIQQAD